MSTASGALRLLCLVAIVACGDPVFEVTAVRPAKRDIEQVLSTNGRIEAAARVAVHAAAAGRVERLTARRGDSVRKGQVLLRIADQGQSAEEARAKAAAAAARARLAQLIQGLDPVRRSVLEVERDKLRSAHRIVSEQVARLERLAARNAVPKSELEARQRELEDVQHDVEALDRQLQSPVSEARREEFEASVREAEAALEAASDDVAALAVRAPRAGVIYSMDVTEGQFLTTGSLIARVGSRGAVRARIFVDEPDLGRIPPGSVAELSADAYPGRAWNCAVDSLASEIIEIGPRRVGELFCTADNPDGALLPNLAVGVRFVLDRATQADSLPRSAVLSDSEGAFAWIMDAGRASRRSVKLGAEGAGFVEIKDGLEGTEDVLLPDGGNLFEGQRVKVRTPWDRTP